MYLVKAYWFYMYSFYVIMKDEYLLDQLKLFLDHVGEIIYA
jgi:hypothetical protein